MPKMGTALVLALREATQSRHRLVEETFDLPSRVRNLDRYRDLLGAFYAIVEPAERRFRDHDLFRRLGLLDGGRERGPALEKDLEHLGVQVVESPIETMEWFTTFDHAVGCAYVLEGSRLGGQIIAHHAQTHGGIDPMSLAFFRGDGRSTAARWRSFLDAIDRCPFIDVEAAIFGACMTFDDLTRSLRQGDRALIHV